MQGDVKEALKWEARMSSDVDRLKFYSRIDSCDSELLREEFDAQINRNANGGQIARDSNGGSNLVPRLFTIVCLFLFFFLA
jgi:hypothetical protein